MEKIVRDRIPEIIRAAGNEPRFRVAQSGERYPLLLEKLYEECREFEAEPSAAELADVLEVVHALAACLGVSPNTLNQIRRDKFVERGGFIEGYVLEI